MSRRQYTDKMKADGLAVLDSCGGNAEKAGRQTGYPANTIRLWNKDRSRATPPEVLSESKKDLTKTLDQARWMYLDRLMEPDAVSKTSGYYAAITLKVLNEAHQLLTGGPTARIEGNLADFLKGSGALPKPAELPKQLPAPIVHKDVHIAPN